MSSRTSTKPEDDDAYERLRASWGFPSFARDFPRHPELDALVAAFAAGDYASVRARAPALAASANEEDVKGAAERLRARIEPDKTARIIFAVTAGLLVLLTVWWVLHDGPQHQGPAPAPKSPQVEIIK